MDKEHIIKQYTIERKTCTEIAKQYNVSTNTIRRFLKACKVDFRPRGKRKGKCPWNRGKTFAAEMLKHTYGIIERGEQHNMSTVGVRRHMKRYLINENGHKCSICGIMEWRNKPVPLVCDHIDGDTTNSNVNNFRLVCCNCDAQLPTYKSKNKKCGDKYNKAYYHIRKNKEE